MAQKPKARERVLKQAAIATDGKPIEVEVFPPGSEMLKGLVEASYGFSLEDARRIKEEREKDPNTHPYELYKRALAMIEAISAETQVVSTRQPWKRVQH